MLYKNRERPKKNQVRHSEKIGILGEESDALTASEYYVIDRWRDGPGSFSPPRGRAHN